MTEKNRDLLIELLEEMDSGRIQRNHTKINFTLTDKETGLEIDLKNFKIINSPMEKCNECKKKVKE